MQLRFLGLFKSYFVFSILRMFKLFFDYCPAQFGLVLFLTVRSIFGANLCLVIAVILSTRSKLNILILFPNE